MIVEHWDNLQITPEKANPSGRLMIDGTTIATNYGETDANKAFISEFIDNILINNRVERIAEYFAGDSFIQHNPIVGDGVSGLGQALADMAAAGTPMIYEKLHHVFGEGNFVLTVSEGRFAGKHVAFYDLFRIEDARLAEHWDVIQNIPDQNLWKNQNGKF
jgi:predicted SnoaL-like aldol condensation-catalyzing enzyme